MYAAHHKLGEHGELVVSSYERTLTLERTQVLSNNYMYCGMHVMLPLTKRRLSNKDKIIW